MRTLLAWLLMTVAVMAEETTNAPDRALVTTNYVKAHWSFRRVDGKLYNIEKSVLWHDFMGTCAKVLTNGIVVQTFVQKHASFVIPPSDSGTSISNLLLGARSTGTSVQTRTWEEEGPTIFLVNYEGAEPTKGQIIRGKAIKIGTYSHEGEVLEKWDCGTPNMVPVIVTNLPALPSKAHHPSAKPPVPE